MTKAKATEPKLESLRKEDLIRMVRKLQKQVAKLERFPLVTVAGARTGRLPVDAVRTLTEAAFVAALDDLAQSGVPVQQRVAAPAFPWSTSALLPTVSPVKPEDK